MVGVGGVLLRLAQAQVDVRQTQLRRQQAVRQVQLEFGVESYDSATSFGNVHDSRVYFRVRRDLLFIK